MDLSNNLNALAVRRVTEAFGRTAQSRAEPQRTSAKRSSEDKPAASSKTRPVRLLDVTV